MCFIFTQFVCMHMNICEIIRSFSEIRQLITVRHLYIISVAFRGVLLTTQFLDVCAMLVTLLHDGFMQASISQSNRAEAMSNLWTWLHPQADAIQYSVITY